MASSYHKNVRSSNANSECDDESMSLFRRHKSEIDHDLMSKDLSKKSAERLKKVRIE